MAHALYFQGGGLISLGFRWADLIFDFLQVRTDWKMQSDSWKNVAVHGLRRRNSTWFHETFASKRSNNWCLWGAPPVPVHPLLVAPLTLALRTWKLWRLSSNLWWILARTTLRCDIWSEGRVAWPNTFEQERLWPEGSEGEQGTDPQARKPPQNQGWGKMPANDGKWGRN